MTFDELPPLWLSKLIYEATWEGMQIQWEREKDRQEFMEPWFRAVRRSKDLPEEGWRG